MTPGVEVSTHARLLPLLFDLWQGCVSSWGFEAKEEASGRQKMRAGHGHYIPFKSTPPTRWLIFVVNLREFRVSYETNFYVCL